MADPKNGAALETAPMTCSTTFTPRSCVTSFIVSAPTHALMNATAVSRAAAFAPVFTPLLATLTAAEPTAAASFPPAAATRAGSSFAESAIDGLLALAWAV